MRSVAGLAVRIVPCWSIVMTPSTAVSRIARVLVSLSRSSCSLFLRSEMSRTIPANRGRPPDGIITIDEQGLIEAFNPAAERLFGYRAAEVLGRNVGTLMPEPYQSEHDRYLKTYLTTGRASIIGIGREVRGLRKDGSTFPMELAVGESRSGGRPLFAGIVRDISERKKSEEELRDSARPRRGRSWKRR